MRCFDKLFCWNQTNLYSDTKHIRIHLHIYTHIHDMYDCACNGQMNLTHYFYYYNTGMAKIVGERGEHSERWTAHIRRCVLTVTLFACTRRHHVCVCGLTDIGMNARRFQWECVTCSELIEIVQMFDGNAIIAVWI